MGGASSFIAILCIAGFLGAAWSASKISKALGISSIVLEIATGVVLGPSVVGLISKEYAVCEHTTHVNCALPSDFDARVQAGTLGKHLGRIAEMDYCNRADYETSRRLAGSSSDYNSYAECIQKSCEADVSYNCGLTPDVFTMIGHAGVAMMIFESGMHFDFDKALIVGPRACVVAVIGTLFPLISGTALTMAYGKPLMPDAIAVGTALAPTSIGIALRLLGEAGVLQDDFGQAIITAAFVDDILSLILFNVLFSLGGDFQFVPVVVYPLVGVTFMGIAMALAVKFWPWVINEQIMPRIKDSGTKKIARKDEVLFLMMIIMLIAYGTITHFLGTHLWGCFIAGMSFACLKPTDHTHHVWVKQTRRITSWMIRIFFACTVAFSIPVAKLLSIDAFWKGSIMGIGPCVLAKVLCAPLMGRAKFVVGWAMVGRAEFAYLIAQMAAAGGMIDEETFSICIWALLYATIFAPFVFRYVLNKYIKEMGMGKETKKEEEMEAQDVEEAAAPKAEEANAAAAEEVAVAEEANAPAKAAEVAVEVADRADPEILAKGGKLTL